MIVLESIFLLDSERLELSYRLGIRAAHFVGKTFAERDGIFRLMREAYRIRSKLAHGDDVEGAEKVANQLDELVRKIIIEYLRIAAQRPHAKLVERTCQEMDARIFERAG